MNNKPGDVRRARSGFSRRTFLGRTAAAGALALTARALPVEAAGRAGATGGAALVPQPAIPTLLGALQRFPLVGVAELHFLQEWHDVMHALLFHPALPSALTDIVVEFGNAQYQELADRFILDDQPVAKAALAQIWRFQGWDAPVYEEFLRTVRAVNWMRPRDRATGASGCCSGRRRSTCRPCAALRTRPSAAGGRTRSMRTSPRWWSARCSRRAGGRC
jgi:hypothetical protein